jgi:diguanylate cyclase (GGDEF)-like protein
MLDIDHFKQFNDTYGHAAGDRMLQSLAAILQTNTRAGDIVCRYGGEEFAVVLPGASNGTARARMEFCRQSFERQALAYDGMELRSTLSAGIASFPADGDEVNLLLDRADKALYLAKEKGRNLVSSFSEVPIH